MSVIMNVTTTVTGALNDFLSRLSSRQEWMDKERLVRAGKDFAARLSALARGESQTGKGELASEDASSDTRGTLKVISGRHSGARIELSEGDYLIGSGESCDVVLLDDGIAERHCRVTLKRKGFTVLDVRGNDVQPLSARSVTHGERTIQSEYEIGGVLISLTLQRQESLCVSSWLAGLAASKWKMPAFAALGAMLMISVALGLQRSAEPATPEQIAALVVSASAELVQRGFESVRFRAVGRSLEVVGFVADLAEEKRLRQWLKKENYSGVRVSVRQIPHLLEDVRQTLRDGALHVELRGRQLRIEGTTHQPSIKDRIQSLARELEGLVEIDDRVVYTPSSVKPGPLPIRLRGVMLDEPRYLVTDTGARYFVGGAMPDGAEVVAIEADGIRFRKEGQTLFYSLE